MRALSIRFAAIFVGVLFALCLLEVVCQILFMVTVAPKLEAQRSDSLHYYTASDDPLLSYVLKPGYQIEIEGRRLQINQDGLRDTSQARGGNRKLALIGDSVPFGIRLSQEQTLAAALQRMTGDSIRVVNFGTPGYGLRQVERFLEVNYPIYNPQKIYYVLNLNDFTTRNTIYEGADNGLYRIYERPFWKLPFFLRKAVYRYHKGGQLTSAAWYRWMFEGNKQELLPIIRRMAEFAESNGSEFVVVLFPPAIAYEDGQFALTDVFDEISQYLSESNIPVMAPIADFSQEVYELQNHTDHFTARGSEVMAAAIWRDMNR